MILRAGSLVLYKSQPALIRQPAEKKLTIELPDGQRLNVRPKDVTLIHPGPVESFQRLEAVPGDPVLAWELLDGQPTTLADLAELAYGEYSPTTAWNAWLVIADGLYFSGTPEAVLPNPVERVTEIQVGRQAKAAEESAWQAFVDRINRNCLSVDDERYLVDVVSLALGRAAGSRVLRQLGKPQTVESAHEFLLSIGYWSSSMNPYPDRLGVASTQPTSAIPELPIEERLDLTHLPAMAIDDEGSNDPDDALSLDNDILWVHIADVSALVPPGSPADLEARDRAANLYLPEGTVHMLPAGVTQKLALGMEPISPALSFALAIEEDGRVQLERVVPSWIHTDRLTYEEAELKIDDDPFNKLFALAEAHLQRRIANGAVEIDLPEVKIRVNETGKVSIKPLPPLKSRLLVREAMLMVGEAIGRLGQQNEIPLAYTVQDASDHSENSMDNYAGMFARRRTMQRSRQQTAAGRHAGLGLDVYVQGTSPLRRYLDLVAHQQLRGYLRGEFPLSTGEIAARIHMTAAPNSAVRSAERLSNQHWTLVYWQQNPDWEGDGVVLEHRPGKSLVLIPDLAWEAELYTRSHPELNSKVRLAIDSVDLPNRTARFRLLDQRGK